MFQERKGSRKDSGNLENVRLQETVQAMFVVCCQDSNMVQSSHCCEKIQATEKVDFNTAKIHFNISTDEEGKTTLPRKMLQLSKNTKLVEIMYQYEKHETKNGCHQNSGHLQGLLCKEVLPTDKRSNYKATGNV